MAQLSIEVKDTTRKVAGGSKSAVLTDEIMLLLNKSNSAWVVLHDKLVGETTQIGVYKNGDDVNYYALPETIDAVLAVFS